MGVFHERAAAHLALKALLHAAGRGEKTHDLTRLWVALHDAGIDLDSALEDRIKRLSRHYMMPRYPDVLPGGEPAAFYGRTDADLAVEDARAVIDAVDGYGETVMRRAIERRRAERRQMIEEARAYIHIHKKGI